MSDRPPHLPCVVICPGIHDPKLTQGFLEGLQAGATEQLSSEWLERVLLFPTQDYPAYSAVHILEFLRQHLGREQLPVVLISFSAGVAGAIAAAWGWQQGGAKVQALIAVDGWGVPLSGSFPIHRLSHDYFTHWSSALLGSGDDSFYADPAVEHLEIWRSPHTCQGWSVQGGKRTFTTAAQFINELVPRYL